MPLRTFNLPTKIKRSKFTSWNDSRFFIFFLFLLFSWIIALLFPLNFHYLLIKANFKIYTFLWQVNVIMGCLTKQNVLIVLQGWIHEFFRILLIVLQWYDFWFDSFLMIFELDLTKIISKNVWISHSHAFFNFVTRSRL